MGRPFKSDGIKIYLRHFLSFHDLSDHIKRVPCSEWLLETTTKNL